MTEQLTFRLGEPKPDILQSLTPEQRRAAEHPGGPLRRYRPAGDPLAHVRGLLDLFGRARDEDVSPEAYIAHARALREAVGDTVDADVRADEAAAQEELAATYDAYNRIKEQHGVVD